MPACLRALFLAGSVSWLSACGEPPPAAPTPASDATQLRVAIRESPTTYARDEDGSASGFEYDLVAEFARRAGLTLTLQVLPSDREILQQVRQGKAHLAVGWLSPVIAVGDPLRTATPYFQSRVAIVQHEASLPIEDADDLAGRTVDVAAGSQLAVRLAGLVKDLPGLRVRESADASSIDLLRQVAEQKVELAVTDGPLLDIAQNYYPQLQRAIEIGDAAPIAWVFRTGADDALFARAQAFLRDAAADGTLTRLKDRYFGHVDRLDTAAAVDFIARTRTLLPRYQALFKQAQIRSGIDWRLLAALAYQESNWDPLATSPTNVRGMMMLTEETADRLRVSDRLDPAQSILAGAGYLADLRDALPASIREPDRTWLALAAYNLGPGHLNGARQIAASLQADADVWHEMKRVLPLMARPEYYRRLKAGRARGGEAVIMVENIRAYFDILRRHLPAYDPFARREEDLVAAKAKLMRRPLAKAPPPQRGSGLRLPAAPAPTDQRVMRSSPPM